MYAITLTIKSEDKEFIKEIASLVLSIQKDSDKTSVKKILEEVVIPDIAEGYEELGKSYQKNKQKAIDLLKKGLPYDEIARATGFSVGQIKAFKAHITMGTYDRRKGV
jgi:uncharacterized protein YerC